MLRAVRERLAYLRSQLPTHVHEVMDVSRPIAGGKEYILGVDVCLLDRLLKADSLQDTGFPRILFR